MRHAFACIKSLFILFLLALPGKSFAGKLGQFLTYTGYPGGSPFAFASGDFNGDGRPDLAVLNSTDGNVTVFLTNRDGTLKKPVTYPIGVNPSSIAVADVNGDGKLDIVVANGGDPKISEFGDVGILGIGCRVHGVPSLDKSLFGEHAWTPATLTATRET